MDSERRRQTNIGTHNKSDRRNDSSTTITSKRQAKGVSTTSGATGAQHNIVIKKDILPHAIRIKSTVPTSTTTSSLKPNPVHKGAMKLTSTTVAQYRSTESVKSTNSSNSSSINPIKPIRLVLEDPVVEDDEEILDGLYTLYLQKRLLAQIAHQKMNYHESKQTDALAVSFVHHAMDKVKIEERLKSFRRMEKEKAQIEKMRGMEKDLDSLLEKIVLHGESQEKIQHFENNLSAVSDVLPIVDHTSKSSSPSFQEKQVEFEDLNFKPMSESYKQIKEISSVPNGPLKIAEDLHQSLEFLQTIQNTSKSEVKDLNDKILQLASLSISKSLLDSSESDTTQIIS